MASTKRIDLFIRPTSNVSKQGAIDYAYDRANDRDDDDENKDEDGDKIYAHYYDVTDSRTGEKYMVFGDDAQDILKLDKLLDVINQDNFLMGFSGDLIIDTEDGTSSIDAKDKDGYERYIYISYLYDDDINDDKTSTDYMNIRVKTKKSTDKFDLQVFNNNKLYKSFEPLDCSSEDVNDGNGIKINYTVIYKRNSDE